MFPRKQLAFYQEHRIPARKLTTAARFSLLLWSRFFHWREALMIVKPETFIGWHRKAFRLWWRWKSRLGRPRIAEDLRRLIVRVVRENCDSTIACARVHRNRYAACRRLVATCHHCFGDEDVCTDRFAADRRATGSLLYAVVSARHSHLRRRLL